MKVRFWGARGSIPAPISPEQIEEKICRAILQMPDISPRDESAVRAYVRQLPPLQRGTAGGNTPCIEIESTGETIILDAGSGIRRLGLEMLKGVFGRGEGTIHLLISHTHWDHIQGFPFFLPAFVRGNRVLIYGVHNLRQAFEDQMASTYFPVPLSSMKSQLTFIPIQPGQSFTIGQTQVAILKNPHPGDSYSFRFEDQHSSLVYASDVEYKQLTEASVQPHIEFFRNADALIFDAQYTLRESWQKVDWGHSSALIGVDLARAAGVKRLVLFHFDPTYTDPDLETIQVNTVAYQGQDQTRPTCEVIVAYEGLALDLTPSGAVGWRLTPDGESAILTPTRIFDERGVAQLESQLKQLSGQATSSIIDLSQVEVLTTASLKSLVMLQQARRDAPIVLASPSDPVRQVIDLAGYGDFFAIYPTLQAALAAIQTRETLNLPGQTLAGRYQIQDKLGESPLGTVINALDLQTNQPVALKLLSPSFTQGAVDRLLQQARRLTVLTHPNIVGILAWEADGAHVFQVMELMSAPTLQSLLSAAPPEPAHSGDLSFEEIVNIVMGIVWALEYAHSHGIVHGNLKPGNVFIDVGGARVCDFGLGRLTEGHNLLEAPMRFQDVAYLAPEQILGQPFDARSDLYALGVILYRLLTGRLPFEGHEQAVMQAQLTEPPRPPGELNPHISASFDHLILKLLAKNPNDRYANAQQVRRILSSLINQAEDGLQARQPVVVGRQQPLAELLACWQQAQAGQGQLVFLTGEQGIGKTTLAQQAAFKSGAPVLLFGRCHYTEGALAYDLFSQVMRSYMATVPPEILDDQARQSLACLEPLVPDIRQMLPDLPDPPPLDPDQDRLRVMMQLVEFVRRATRQRPWFVILDDLQRADPNSLELLIYLGRHLPTMPILLVGTYRDLDIDRQHPLSKALQDLSRYPTYRHFPLERLGQAGVKQLLEVLWQQAIPEPVVERIYQHTEGNPFYVEEIAKCLADEGLVYFQDGQWRFANLEQVRLPATVHEVVWRRIGHLRQETQMLLSQAAVLGASFLYIDLLAISGMPEWQVLEHLDFALERQLVQEIPGEAALRFRHAEIQRVLYEDLGPIRRRILHRQAAEALERRSPAGAEQLAYHFYLAGEHEKIIVYGLQAGLLAQEAYANDVAILWFQRVLETLERFGPDEAVEFQETRLLVHHVLGEVLILVARFEEAHEQFKAAQQLLETQPLTLQIRRQLADICRQLARIADWRSDYEQAVMYLERGLSLLQQDDLTPELARLHSFYGWILVRQGNHDKARSRLKMALDLARRIGLLQVQAHSLYSLAVVFSNLKDNTSAILHGELALADFRQMGDRIGEGRTLNVLAVAWQNQADPKQAHAFFSQSLRVSQEIGDRRGEANVLGNIGVLFRAEHKYLEAIEYDERSLQVSREIGYRLGEGLTLADLGAAYDALGAYEQAHSRFDQAWRVIQELDEQNGWVQLLENMGLYAYHQGDYQTALDHSQRALSLARELNLPEDQAVILTHIGHALMALGQLSEAAQAYREAGDLHRQLNRPKLAMEPLAGLARVELALGELVRASSLVDSILTGLQPETLYGTREPFRIYLTCYQVLRAAQDPLAGVVLQTAYELLQEQALQIEDPALRSTFLEHNPTHRQLLEIARANSTPPADQL
jgi:phosphoribosyl 1,2-cyclic phosphodiesterase/tetratricopeptide (TPR) repeat protein/anti-anti-sigma regulatory factor